MEVVGGCLDLKLSTVLIAETRSAPGGEKLKHFAVLTLINLSAAVSDCTRDALILFSVNYGYECGPKSVSSLSKPIHACT